MSLNRPDSTSPIIKPNANIVEDMFNAQPSLFQYGRHPLPPGDHPLNTARIQSLHLLHCANCRPCHPELNPSCYFSTMLRCITHGWQPPFDATRIAPRYTTHGNYPSLASFPDSVRKEITDMISQGVLRPAAADKPGLTHPLGAQVKNSDRVRARVLANVEITDQASMDAASTALLALGSTKVKCRLTLDPTATGLNDATDDAPFRYPSLHDMLDLVRPGCSLALTDIGRYFHTFPLALESRPWFRVSYADTLYEYARCPFGYKTCPYYCSAWSAEIKLWLQAIGITTAHLMDDWLAVAPTNEEAADLLRRIEDLLVSAGFTISDKTRVSTREVLLGVMVDTPTMRLMFDPTQSQGMAATLSSFLPLLHHQTPPDPSLVRHICGKLNWYGEILQSGRLRTSRWWQYCRHGHRLHPQATSALIDDTHWWINLLNQWGSQSISTLAYPIINPASLATNPDLVRIIQSDASGTDGYGFTMGRIDDDSLPFHSFAWSQSDPPPSSSHACELRALQRAVHTLMESSRTKPQLIIWITDSMAACYSVNKGLARKDEGFHIVADILQTCDTMHSFIIALWVPRENNLFADYLSHLACSLHRERVAGVINAQDAFTWHAEDQGNREIRILVP